MSKVIKKLHLCVSVILLRQFSEEINVCFVIVPSLSLGCSGEKVYTNHVVLVIK